MKNFAKFIPVALGLLTLASCSSDDLFGEKSVAEEAQAGDLFVTMEDLQEDGSVFTRSYIDATTNSATRKYVPLDELKVYDNDLHKFDIYAFTWTKESENIGVFRRKNTESNITSAKWAIYPKAYMKNGHWEYNESTNLSYTEAQIELPDELDYDATYAATDTKFETPLYKDVLPRWGAVSAIDNGDKLQTSLKYMTGVLRLKLAGIPKYANAILVKMLVGGLETNQVTMNGVFTTKIAKNDIADPDAQLAMKGSEPGWSKTDGIKINTPAPKDLLDAAKSHAVLYVPLVTTGETVVDIVIYAPEDGITDPDAATKAHWKEIKRFKDKKIAKAKLYGNKSELNLAVDGEDVNSINDALEMTEPDAETIELTATSTDGIEVCAGGNNTIYIPNKPGVNNIIIDLSNGVYGCATGTTLYIQDKDPGNRFTGNVLLIGAKKSGEAAIQLDVQLPSAEGFAFAGNAVEATGATDPCFTIDAKSFTLGDGKTSTSYKQIRFAMSENVKTFNVAENADINANGITVSPTAFKAVKAINVMNGKIIGGIDASAALNAVDITATGDEAEISGAPITTKGTVTISSKKNNFDNITADGAISVSSEAKATDVWSKESTVTLTDKAQAESVKAKGNISIDEEAFVIDGTITSDEGNIVISNEYTANKVYQGAMTATLGSINLNEVGDKTSTFNGPLNAGVDVVATGNVIISQPITAGQDVKLSGKASASKAITAGRDFFVTEEASATSAADAVTLTRNATVNITKNDGDAVAVAGSLTFKDGTAYALNLLSGYVNKVDNLAGAVALSFATTPAFAAIHEVVNADNLVPITKSIWNGKPITVTPTVYRADIGSSAEDRIWTASQLGMQLATASNTIAVRSDIDLNNEDWTGIEPTGTYTIVGNYKTISNIKAKGNKTAKTAGFINAILSGKALKVSNLTLDGVQTDITTISGGEYNGGIGAVVGNAVGTATLERVKVKLAGENFGSKTNKNILTESVGGLIGHAADVVNLNGVQVDANGAALTGYRYLGGFIGKADNHVYVKMMEEDGSDPEVVPTATGIKFYVTFDATIDAAEVNDPYQGMTGIFVGSIDLKKNITIADVENVKPAIVYVKGCKADESKAFKIEGTTHRYHFYRDADNADQTLIGNSGFDISTVGTFKINKKTYEVYKTGVPFTVGHPKLYSLIDELHKD